MIKLVASDLDGTLLLHKAQSLPEEIFSLIRQLEELGIMFVAASGRQYPNMTKLFAPVASEISYISENGALAVDHGEDCIRILLTESWQGRLFLQSWKRRMPSLPVCKGLPLPDAEDKEIS